MMSNDFEQGSTVDLTPFLTPFFPPAKHQKNRKDRI
jgi:hypothetical protein